MDLVMTPARPSSRIFEQTALMADEKSGEYD